MTTATPNRIADRISSSRQRVVMSSPDRPRDLEPAVLEEEGVRLRAVVRAPEFQALDPPLERDFPGPLHRELDHAVREELLLEPGVEGGGGHLRDQEGREAGAAEPLEEPERLPAAVLELEEGLEGVPGGARDDARLRPPLQVQELCLQVLDETGR